MKVRTSHKSIWLELGVLLALVVSALLCAPAPHSSAQKPRANRQLDRDPAQQKQTGQRRLALVMGNGAYQNANPLKNPPNDAKAIADALRELGFEVTLGTNKPQREMKQMMREFGQRLRTQGGVGLFYYAGHGVQAKGHNYLVPVAAVIQSEADLEDEAIDVNYVLNLMDEAQNALNIVILDACRNNPFGRSFRSAANGLAQVKAPTGTLIAYATAPDDIAADGGGANSPYTEELIKEMRQPGVLIETMFRRVAEQVSSRSGGRQEPWFSANVKGDFYFKAVANDASGPTTRSKPNAALADATTVEAEYWESIKESNDKTDFQDYLKEYPQGRYAPLARVKLRQLEAASKPNDGKPNNAGAGNAGVTSGAANTTGNTTGGARPALKAGAVVKNQMGIEMVYIPPGEFMMGSDRNKYEQPVHRVTISQAFYIGRYEVTQAQWQSVIGNNPSGYKKCGGNCPVETVSWDDAQNFINKLNEGNDGFRYRLPTEAEWEYACRAGTTGDYAGDLDSMAWYDKNSGAETHPVGTRQPNGFGLYDMHGNVGEWCQDWYAESYYASSPASDPQGPGSSFTRVMRGGSWDYDASFLRSAVRLGLSPGLRSSGLGFRVVAMLRTP
jgi:formylglycine-generating enzyme required for sulfatase activity